MPATHVTSLNTEAAIFARLWDDGMTAALARQVLKLRFSSDDETRMKDLSRRNRAGELTPPEGEELDNFIRVGDLLAILQSKARQQLKVAPARNGHG